MSQQINLFNPVFLKQQKLFSGSAMTRALALLGLGLIGLAAISSYRVRQIEAESVAIAAKSTATQTLMTKMVAQAVPEKSGVNYDAAISQMEMKLRSSQNVLGFLQNSEAGTAMAYSEYFRAFSRKALPGVWLTGFIVNGDAIEIQGRMLQPTLLPSYMKALQGEAAFKGKSFASIYLQAGESDRLSPQPGSAVRAPVSPSFIEFSLNSSDTTRDASMNGGKAK